MSIKYIKVHLPWWICFERFCIDIPNRWHTTWQWRRNGIVIIHNCITFLVLHWFHRHHAQLFCIKYFMCISHKFFSLLFVCFSFLYFSDSHENVGVDDDMIVGKILCMSNLMAKKSHKFNSNFTFREFFFIRRQLEIFSLWTFNTQ